MVNIYSSISSWHMSFWCPFLLTRLAIYHSNTSFQMHWVGKMHPETGMQKEVWVLKMELTDVRFNTWEKWRMEVIVKGNICILLPMWVLGLSTGSSLIPGLRKLCIAMNLPLLTCILPLVYVALLWGLPTPFTILTVGFYREMSHPVSICESWRSHFKFQCRSNWDKFRSAQSEDLLSL